MRRVSFAAAAAASVLFPGAGHAEGLLASLIDSVRRTPSGIALERPGGGRMTVKLAETESGVPKPETGTLKLKLGDSSVAFAARESLDSQFDSVALDIGGLPKSPYLGLTGFGMMTRQDMGDLDVASALVMAPEGERMAASEVAIDTGPTSVLLQGGFKENPAVSDAAGFTEGPFGGAAFEGRVGGVGYSLRWHGSVSGSSGAFSLQHGGAALGVAKDFGAGILAPTPRLTARWKHPLPLGSVDFRLKSMPQERTASTRVNWSLEW